MFAVAWQCTYERNGTAFPSPSEHPAIIYVRLTPPSHLKPKPQVTDFYEYGWGQSFHFGPRWKGEGFVESIKRAEYHLCSRLGMKPGMRALDVGCGVGGPMRNMAIFSGAQIDGITINEYQARPSVRSVGPSIGCLVVGWWSSCWRFR